MKRAFAFAAFLALASCQSQPAYAVPMIASWYDCSKPGDCSRSKRTASGERFAPNGLTAAHRTLPLGTRLRVCRHGQCVVVRVNDRGPAKWTGRTLDLSRGAAARLGMIGTGVATVQTEVVR